jgi:hypothetical protein
MRWPWNSQLKRETNHVAPLRDGDVYQVGGWPRWTDLIASDKLHEPTQQLPVLSSPLLTPAQRWRSGRGCR